MGPLALALLAAAALRAGGDDAPLQRGVPRALGRVRHAGDPIPIGGGVAIETKSGSCQVVRGPAEEGVGALRYWDVFTDHLLCFPTGQGEDGLHLVAVANRGGDPSGGKTSTAADDEEDEEETDEGDEEYEEEDGGDREEENQTKKTKKTKTNTAEEADGEDEDEETARRLSKTKAAKTKTAAEEDGYTTDGSDSDSGEAKGKSGFGDGAEVSLRLSPHSDASLDLEPGVVSQALPMDADMPVRLMGLHTSWQTGADMPLILVAPPEGRTEALVDIVIVAGAPPTEQMTACKFHSGSARFACRASEVSADVRLVLICNGACRQEFGRKARAGLEGPCFSVHKVSDGLEGENPDVDIASVVNTPWVSWTARTPAHTTAGWGKHFRIYAWGLPGQEGVAEYEAVLLVSDAPLRWDTQGIAPAWYAPLRLRLAMAALVAIGLYLVALVLWGLGLPVAILAPLPALGCTLASLQLLAAFGSPGDAPDRLRALAEPLDMLRLAGPVAGLLAAAAVLRSLALLLHIYWNGDGSADYLPHGLRIGGWELRLVGLFALPLGLKAGEWILEPRTVDTIVGVAGAVLLLALPCVAVVQVRTWQREKLIVKVPLPGDAGDRWTDTTCDQLRAVPMGAFIAAGCADWRLLRRWPQIGAFSGAWYFAPTVARIAAMTRYDRGTFSVWGRAGTVFDVLGHVGTEDDARLSSSSVPAMSAHPIRVKTQFVFTGGRTRPRVAGVVGLPWLQAAVPAELLPQLEAELGVLELRVCPAQLCGPRTCGRLGALFDWCHRYPEYWPVDMAAKVLLGLYLAALRVMGSSRWWVLLHLGVAACSVGCCVLVLKCRPYASALDNAALLALLSTVALGASQYQLSHFYLPKLLADVVPFVMAVMVACQAVLLATTSACVILAALLASCKTVSTVVPSVVRGWHPDVAEDEDAVDDTAVQDEDAEREERRSVAAMVTLVSGNHVMLPARVSAPFQVREVALSTTSAKEVALRTTSAREMVATAGRGCLKVPLAASGLFSQKANGMPMTQPFGVLDMPDGAVALYEASSLNMERSPWEQLLIRHLRGNEDALRKADAFLSEGLQRLKDSPGYLEGSYNEEMLAVRAVQA